METKSELRSTGLLCDQSSKVDYLGFKPYVEAVAAFLTDVNTATPLTMSVEGDWGIGKSSFLAQLSEKLSEIYKAKKNTYYCINFNPWRYSESEALWAAFAVEFEKQLTKGWPTKIKLVLHSIEWKKLGIYLIPIIIPILGLLMTFCLEQLGFTLYLDILKHIFSVGIVILSLNPAIELVKQIIGKLSKSLINFDIKNYQKERPSYQGKIPFLEKFHADINFLAKSLAGDSRIYVFIDDLDRCEPGQAVELMQAINLMISDQMKAIFILAVDRKKVAAGITVKCKEYVELLGVEKNSLAYGYEFIDKFIQLPFLLPQPKSEDIDKFFDLLITFKIKKGSSKDVAIDLSDKKAKIKSSSSKSVQITEQPETSVQPQAISRKFENHLDEVRAVLSEIAPLLQNNPRKIKKFLNIFQLQVHLGSQTGLFGFYNEPDAFRINVYQLGIFLVCAYVWPDFVLAWSKYPGFITHFLMVSEGVGSISEDEESMWASIRHDSGLSKLEFERYKYTLNHFANRDQLSQFFHKSVQTSDDRTILYIPVHLLLNVSPVYESTDLIEQVDHMKGMNDQEVQISFSGHYVRKDSEYNSATIMVLELPDGSCRITGNALYGLVNPGGPNVGTLDFVGELDGNHIVYSWGLADGSLTYQADFQFIPDGLIVTEPIFDQSPYGHNVSFRGTYVKVS